MFLQYFDAVGWVLWPVKTVARITYTVLVETLNPAQSINQHGLQLLFSPHIHAAFRSQLFGGCVICVNSDAVWWQRGVG